MAGNYALQMLRGDKSKLSDEESQEELLPGQPFYDTKERKLYIGDENNTTLGNAKDIQVSNVTDTINGKKITDIFEADGIQVKNATLASEVSRNTTTGDTFTVKSGTGSASFTITNAAHAKTADNYNASSGTIKTALDNLTTNLNHEKVYDLVIRTQQEFDDWILNKQNSGLKSVLIVGGGGSLSDGAYDLSKTTPVTTYTGMKPVNLYTLHGIDNVIIRWQPGYLEGGQTYSLLNITSSPDIDIDGLNFQVYTYIDDITRTTYINVIEGGKYNQDTAARQHISNCSVMVGGARGGIGHSVTRCFQGCHHISNCGVYGDSAYLDRWIQIHGFARSRYLNACEVVLTTKSAANAVTIHGFDDCQSLSNCNAILKGMTQSGAASLGKSSMSSVVVGFYNCLELVNCRSAVSSYGTNDSGNVDPAGINYSGITKASNCTIVAGDQYPGVKYQWGGTCIQRDPYTCDGVSL